MFNVDNYQVFGTALKEKAAGNEITALLLFCFCSAFIVMAHKLPKLAKSLNPFYRIANELKKAKPHVEDDKEMVVGYTNGEFR